MPRTNPDRETQRRVLQFTPRRDVLELIDHLKGIRRDGTGPYPAEWFGTLRHLRRREILAAILETRRTVGG